MTELCGDPYEGARRAFLVLNPHATDGDWESWVTKSTEQANGQIDNFEAFARLCKAAISSEDVMDNMTARQICYAGGYFEAMARLLTSLLDMMPTSSCIPHHEAR